MLLRKRARGEIPTDRVRVSRELPHALKVLLLTFCSQRDSSTLSLLSAAWRASVDHPTCPMVRRLWSTRLAQAQRLHRAPSISLPGFEASFENWPTSTLRHQTCMLTATHCLHCGLPEESQSAEAPSEETLHLVWKDGKIISRFCTLCLDKHSVSAPDFDRAFLNHRLRRVLSVSQDGNCETCDRYLVKDITSLCPGKTAWTTGDRQLRQLRQELWVLNWASKSTDPLDFRILSKCSHHATRKFKPLGHAKTKESEKKKKKKGKSSPKREKMLDPKLYVHSYFADFFKRAGATFPVLPPPSLAILQAQRPGLFESRSFFQIVCLSFHHFTAMCAEMSTATKSALVRKAFFEKPCFVCLSSCCVSSPSSRPVLIPLVRSPSSALKLLLHCRTALPPTEKCLFLFSVD